MRVFKSGSLVGFLLAWTAGCGLPLGGLATDGPAGDAGGTTTSSGDLPVTPEAGSAEAAAAEDGGQGATDAVAAPPDSPSVPEAQSPAEAGGKNPPGKAKNEAGQGQDEGDDGG
jgi:hypothetical protein